MKRLPLCVPRVSCGRGLPNGWRQKQHQKLAIQSTVAYQSKTLPYSASTAQRLCPLYSSCRMGEPLQCFLPVAYLFVVVLTLSVVSGSTRP